jgi:hypothetical protein
MIRENKIAFIRVKLIEGWKGINIRRELGIPKSTYFYWKSLIEQGKYASLVNKQKPGPKPTFHIDPTNQQRMLFWRKKYGWGPTKIEGHLNVHFNVHVPHNRIHQLFITKGLNKPVLNPRKTWGKRIWEREHSMTLFQADWKDINCETRYRCSPSMTTIRGSSSHRKGLTMRPWRTSYGWQSTHSGSTAFQNRY